MKKKLTAGKVFDKTMGWFTDKSTKISDVADEWSESIKKGSDTKNPGEGNKRMRTVAASLVKGALVTTAGVTTIVGAGAGAGAAGVVALKNKFFTKEEDGPSKDVK